MWKHIAANGLTFITVALFVGAGAVTWGVNQYSAEGPLTEPICLRVAPGSNMRRVSGDLVEAGAVSSQWIFDAGVDYSDRAPLLKAGSFMIEPGASMSEIVQTVTGDGVSNCGTRIIYSVGVSRTTVRVRERDVATDEITEIARFDLFEDEPPQEYLELREAADTQYFVQVVEGTTVWQVITALNALEVLDGSVRSLPPEGSLAPDQYDFVAGTEAADLVDQMMARQAAILAEAWEQREADIPVTTPEEALILASIIEKETAIAEERPLVSSVLSNRIVQGWRLQFDPTIIYGITRGEGLLDRPISQADIRGATEQRLHGEITYNTYQIDGLPAGPIANPGREAIFAAVAPAETDLMFFAADGSGGHAFAVTLEEHNQNVARLRELEAAGGN